jgi:hypothetical protein
MCVALLQILVAAQAAVTCYVWLWRILQAVLLHTNQAFKGTN